MRCLDKGVFSVLKAVRRRFTAQLPYKMGTSQNEGLCVPFSWHYVGIGVLNQLWWRDVGSVVPGL